MKERWTQQAVLTVIKASGWPSQDSDDSWRTYNVPNGLWLMIASDGSRLHIHIFGADAATCTGWRSGPLLEGKYIGTRLTYRQAVNFVRTGELPEPYSQNVDVYGHELTDRAKVIR